MPEEIDPFAVKQPADEPEPIPQEESPEVIGDDQGDFAAPDDILSSINSVPNPVHAPNVEKDSILSRVKPRGRKNRNTPTPVDGVAPYDSATGDEAAPEPEVVPEPQFVPPPEPAPMPEPEPRFEDIPAPVPEVAYPEQAYQQPEYQQPQYQEYQQGYANPLLTNQPLPTTYTAPNVYDPYNPYATMVDINQGAPGAAKNPDWRFIGTLGAAIVCLAGLIFFWIMWGSTAASLTDTTIQMEDLRTKSETGQKAANQLTDLQTTIRELNSKVEDLQKENDDLKKNGDKVKDLEKDNKSLEEKVKSLQDDKATLQKDVEYWKDRAK